MQNVQTLPDPAGGQVGYMLFNDHLATAESELVAAFGQLASVGVHDLVLDIRYNGGGFLDIASEVAFMIAGPGPTSGQTFDLVQFNSRYPTIDPVTQAPITPVGFHTTTQGFSLPTGQALPSLSLARVFVLTGHSTCSASEAIINSLQGQCPGHSDRVDDVRQAVRVLPGRQLRGDVLFDPVPRRQRQGFRRLPRRVHAREYGCD